MEEKRLHYLLDRHQANKLTEEEAIELEQWHQQQQDNGADWIDETNITERDHFIAAMSAEIMGKIGDKQTGNFRRIYKKRVLYWSAAAAVLFLAGLFWFTMVPSIDRHSYAKVSPDQVETDKRVMWDTVLNNTGRELRFLLPDSSEAVMADNGVISYRDGFAASKREIFLIKGKVRFNVRKNAQRPFIVYSQDISTTALGTSFTVSSFPGKKVKIQLHEGKVVVRANKEEDGVAFQPVYMKPGDEVDVNTGTLTVSIIGAKLKDSREDEQLALQRKINGLKEPLVFEQDSLSHVFTKLSAVYGKRIEFDKSMISQLDFSGIIRKEDKLATILHKISLLNNLSVKETTRGYVIKKK